jgi:molybdopterin converting factor small subunit
LGTQCPVPLVRFGILAGNAAEYAQRFSANLRAKVGDAKKDIETQMAFFAEIKERYIQEVRYQLQERQCLQEYMEAVEENHNKLNML